MKYVAPHASFGYKLILGNLWLFSSILSSILSKGSTDAIQRTTTAVTIIRGGIKSNVLPSEASAVVNHRIHPADTIETVIAQDVSELTTKGQLISICPFGVIVTTNLPMKKFDKFCPRIGRAEFVKFFRWYFGRNDDIKETF